MVRKNIQHASEWSRMVIKQLKFIKMARGNFESTFCPDGSSNHLLSSHRPWLETPAPPKANCHPVDRTFEDLMTGCISRKTV